MTDAVRGYPGFPGRIGRTREESEPHWDRPAIAPKGAPNVVVIFMDDMGWSDIGCYGSEIDTPNIDALARRGVRFNHYTTHPICSPARAALLTGRNAHSVATGWLSNNSPGFPGYSGNIPLDCPTFAETFRAAGYATAAVGKWHNATNSATPNSAWPTMRGFDWFYGFLEGETGYFSPARIVYNNIVAPIDEYPEGYYATDDWTDKAIGFLTDIRNHNPVQPFQLYVAYNAVHGPLQAKEKDLAKYRGKFDDGWDHIRARRLERQKTLGIVPPDTRLSDRDADVPDWNAVPEDQKKLYVRHMEAYAAVLDCADQNIGRLVAHIERLGELDNTIIVFSSDNGGTSSAGPTGMVHFNRRFAGLPLLPVEQDVEQADLIGTARVPALYPTGWGQVSNAPFPSYKTYTGGGGRRVACIMSWPAQLKDAGAIRTQFAHVTDIMPTLLDLAGVPALAVSHGHPAKPMHGASLANVLRESTDSPRREQYYECWANRAYYRDGWLAVSLQVKGQKINFDNWSLHCHAEDFSESMDLARQHPEKLKELIEAFDEAAWANLVYPLDGRSPMQKFQQLPPHQQPPVKAVRRFLPGGQTVHRGIIVPLIADRNFTIAVRFTQGEGSAGILFAIGDVTGGMALYVEDGCLKFFYNGFGEYSEIAGAAVAAGPRTAYVDYEASGKRKGKGRLRLDSGEATDWSDLSPTFMGGFHEGLDIGLDRRGPVSWDLFEKYGAFRYDGAIDEVTIETGPFAPDSNYGKG